MLEEGESGQTEEQQLGEMRRGLAGGLRSDQFEAVEADSEEEGCDEGARRTDDGADGASRPAEQREAAADRNPFGIEAEQQPALAPRGHEDEDADGEAQCVGRRVLDEGNGQGARGQEEEHEGDEEIAPDGSGVDQGPARIRGQLDQGVDRDRHRRLEEEQHDGEQHDPAGHAEDRGDPGSEHAGPDEGDEGGGFHAASVSIECGFEDSHPDRSETA